MLKVVEYAALLQLSSKGISVESKKSQKVTGDIKAGRLDEKIIRRTFEVITEAKDQLHPFLNPEVTLIPAPRSSKIQDGALWPSLEIVKMLAFLGFGTPASCLIRSVAIRKSAFCRPEERPTIAEHFNSMVVENYVPSANITLVDDVITKGATSLAGASRLAEKFPNATIRVFAMIRTNNFVSEIQDVKDVLVGTITYNSHYGTCSRQP